MEFGPNGPFPGQVLTSEFGTDDLAFRICQAKEVLQNYRDVCLYSLQSEVGLRILIR